VAIASRGVDKCQELADRLSRAVAECVALKLDVFDESQVRDVVDKVADRFGRFDILVNNAYSGKAPNLEDATGDDLIASFRGNTVQYFAAAQQAARHMRKVGGGSIINIASMYGVVGSYPEAYVGFPVNSPVSYHACKGAVVHLTRHLAVYWAKDNIRVNTIKPRPVPQGRDEARLPRFH